ncbi:MAG: insulinase family protein [Oscillospiraceae bacterium]|nr:insulinase family protein [Oscillospiraceae bacterium]
MQIIENDKVKEKLYIKKLESGLTIMIIPKKNTKRKYVIFGTNYGSVDSKFIIPKEENVTEVPDGVAHFLEHKMFEQEDGTNSLDTLTSLGVSANAYTTTDHTAYLFEATDNFYEALDELMNYIQHPYFTDENVEKEKGIIGQEIMMYDDVPEWKVYLNLMKALYKDNPIKLDIAGKKETISQIDKDILYKCYNTFYHPSNMALVISGDFEPSELLKEIEKRLLPNENKAHVERIYPEEQAEIAQEYIEESIEISTSLFLIGIKDEPQENQEMIKRSIAVEIILRLLIGKSSALFKELYDRDFLQDVPDISYDFSKTYAFVSIGGQSRDSKRVLELLKRDIEKFEQEGINEEDFQRTRKAIYADYIKEYNGVDTIAKMFLRDFFQGINSFDYLEEYESVTKNYVEQVLRDVFRLDKIALSVVRSNLMK